MATGKRQALAQALDIVRQHYPDCRNKDQMENWLFREMSNTPVKA